jgi:hypothetical protein
MDEQTAIAAFVGNKSSYYAQKWQRENSGSPPPLSVNLAAVFLGIFWLAYRKLYLPLLAVVGVMFVDGSLSGFLEEYDIVPASVIMGWDALAPFMYTAVLGGFGNRWYWGKFRKAWSEARDASPDPALQEEFLRGRGGTSWPSALALLAVGVGLIALIIYTMPE